MSENLSSLCSEFTRCLSSSAPVPGGGGAAALCGALAAALGAMSVNLSMGKKSTAPHRDELELLLEETESARLALLALIDADAENFRPLSEAYSIPGDDPDRAEILSRASLCACAAPRAIIETCAALAAAIERLAVLCSRIMISDVGCAAVLCRAAMEAAEMNVLVNLPAVRDEKAAEELYKISTAYTREYALRLDALSKGIASQLEMN